MPNFEDKARDTPRTEPDPQAEAVTAPVPSAATTLSEVPARAHADAPQELGGREGPEPTRFGDWELRGRCIDF